MDPSVGKRAAQLKDSARVIPQRALDLSSDVAAPIKETSTVVSTHRSDANVVAAAALRVNDQPRFQKIHNLIKNREKEIADHVMRAFGKTGAREWMAVHVGNPPEATDARLSKLELAQISLVAIALTKYGAEKLNQLYDRKLLDHLEDVPLYSYELRSAEQNKFRDHSRSTQKERKDVAHYAGLDFVLKLNEELPEQHRVARQTLQTVLNDFSNFRMVKLETNRGLHKEVDALLLRVHEGDPVRLTSVQRQRVEQVVQFFQSELFQTTMVENRGKHLYAKIRRVIDALDAINSGRNEPKLWDARRDKRQLQAPTVSAYLRDDGSPDRRFRENKVLTQSELERTEPVSSRANTVRLKKDGTPDLRFKQPSDTPTASRVSSAPPPSPVRTTVTVPVPVSAAPRSRPVTSTSKEPSVATASSSAPAGVRLKKDGTPDRRFKENR